MAGQPGMFQPSRVVHLVGQSTGINRKPKRLPPYLFEARRRYFLKNHTPLYAAMIDLGMIVGLSLWRLRVIATGKEDTTPLTCSQTTIRHSVFFKALD